MNRFIVRRNNTCAPKAIRWVLFLFLSCLLSTNAADDNLQTTLEMRRQIDGLFVPGQRGKLVVPNDVFGQSYNFPDDLRILGTDGTQWPFFLYIPSEKTTTKTLEPEIINRSFVEGKEPYLQVDLIIPKVDGKPPLHNWMELRTSGHNYIRRIEVYTGAEEQPSAQIATGYLIDDSRQRNAKNQIIRYPPSDTGRLHVRIYSNARSAEESFDLNQAFIQYHAVTVAERETVKHAELPVPSSEQDRNAQTFLLDTRVRRPVEFIELNIETPSFSRSVSVYGRNSDYEQWNWVGGGEIHSLEGDTNHSVRINAKNRFLKVQIFHYDDQPLEIQSLTLQAIPRYLVFEAQIEGRANLYYGNPKVHSPQYDLRHRMNRDAIQELHQYGTLEPQSFQAPVKEAWKQYSKPLGILVVAVVSLLVIWVIVSMLRQQGLVGPENKPNE
jgi:hypothetical protein